jgi:hypothetical protein
MTDQLFEIVDQDTVADEAVSRGAAIESAALGAAGVPEIVGELRDEVDFTAPFTEDAGVDCISPGDEDANNVIGAMVAVDSAIYRDYYDGFGAFHPCIVRIPF